MSDELWFRFFPSKFMAGIRGLSANEVKVYISLLCRMYERGGPLKNDIEILATYCEMRPSSFEAALARLVRLEKVSLTTDGLLSNAMVEREISRRVSYSEIAKRAGKKSAEKRQSNQSSEATDAERPVNHIREKKEEKREDIDGGGGGSARAREASPPENPNPADPTFRERILAAIGVDPVSGLTGHGGRMIGTRADMAEADRWIAAGLSEGEIVAVVAESMAAKADGPPSTFRYFEKPMARLVAAKASGALPAAPVNAQGPPGAPVESEYDRLGRILAEYDAKKGQPQ